MKAARIDLIEAYIIEKKSVSLESICEHFNISKSTARRDLDELVKRGNTKKVYGGIRALEPDVPASMPLLPFEERDIVNQTEKGYIYRQAARLIMPDDIIFIDTGTTCLQLRQKSIRDTHTRRLSLCLLQGPQRIFCEKQPIRNKARQQAGYQ